MDQTIDNLLRPGADAIAAFIFYAVEIGGAQVPLIVAWLIVGGVFFTFYLRFINFSGFMEGLRLLTGHRKVPPGAPGEISAFEALSTAVSGTVGIGNIAGVAIAISLGGPGATLWMIAAGFLGMATKFGECTLGVHYRRQNPDGSVSGGPMHYLERGLAEQGMPGIGKALGTLYALAMVVGCLGIGNMFQANQAAAIITDVTGGDASPLADNKWILGVVMAGVVAFVLIGGIRGIARVTSKLVPFMAVLYVVSAVVVVALNAERLPWALGAIVTGAFTPSGVAGGMIGVIIIGFRRAVFSNEAGLGSAAIAHSAVRTNYPATEGYVALLEPFIDTVIICTLTALVITTTIYTPELAGAGIDGIEMTSRAFEQTLAFSPIPLAIAASLFAFSTILSWSYYGLKAVTYLLGEGMIAQTIYKVVFCGFIIVGASIQLKALIDLSDALVFLVAIPNLLGLYLLAPVIKSEIQRYQESLSGI